MMDPWPWDKVTQPNFLFNDTIDTINGSITFPARRGDQALQWVLNVTQNGPDIYPSNASDCQKPGIFADINKFAICLLHDNMTEDITALRLPNANVAINAGFTRNSNTSNDVTNYIFGCLQAWCRGSDDCFKKTQKMPSTCVANNTKGGQGPMWSSTYECLNLICQDPGLPEVNPDIGGIGGSLPQTAAWIKLTMWEILASYFMQIGIVLLACLAILLISTHLRIRKHRSEGTSKSKRGAYIERISNFLVEFQKAQCFFAGALQIAALLYIYRKGDEDYQKQPWSQRLADYSALVNVSQTGVIPVLYVLYTIFTFHKPSRTVTLLSIITVALALCVALNRILFNAVPEDNPIILPDDLGRNGPSQCGLYPAFRPCSALPAYLDHINIARHTAYTYIVFVPLIPYFLYGLLKDSRSSQSGKVQPVHFSSQKPLETPKHLTVWHWVMHTYFQITFLSMLAWQIYLLSNTLRYTTNRTDWGFGQVVGVSVWIPALVQYLYDEAKVHLNPEQQDQDTLAGHDGQHQVMEREKLMQNRGQRIESSVERQA